MALTMVGTGNQARIPADPQQAGGHIPIDPQVALGSKTSIPADPAQAEAIKATVVMNP
jgi:hypothetical protein